ncbi:NADH dehydrogenase [ubiquinone] 1 alpha subcomplex subunit 9, mitochondrial [Vitis vinifera]|uniref:NADH dehydrogenase [ubiquinone] 1 alpha subcomplex subunit 9, mitochondrial n=1 Tax=Vitis vinifera TaxID=29760 RepID=A0A438F178_VITVI|nr:NADH dehydrogenase [ubiquinone] 1 alpha subcomplex subunit 9, mitochondrial [Vitis vinifera]
MQALSRRLAHQSFNQSPAISSLKSIYPLSDHYYGADHPRLGSTLAPKGVGHLVRKGTGGRSSVSGIVAVVFGATGFLGRYVVQQLAKMGSQVLVPFRGSEDSHRHLKLMGDLGQIVPMKYNPRDENSIKAVMAKANVVLNLIGREYETRNYSFEEVNHHMAEQLAMISKEHGGIMRFIQVSCLGASPSSPSRMLMAKAAAEEAVLRELPESGVLLKAEAPPRELVFQPWGSGFLYGHLILLCLYFICLLTTSVFTQQVGLQLSYHGEDHLEEETARVNMHRKVKKEHIPSWLALNRTKDQTENLRDGVLVVASCLSASLMPASRASTPSMIALRRPTMHFQDFGKITNANLHKATIMRPAVMIGTEDRILNRWAQFAKNYGFLPLYGDGSTKFQPVYVIDVAAAIMAALKDDGTSMGKVYELGGPEIFTMHELAAVMYDTIREWPRYVKVPFPIAKAMTLPREILLNKVPFPLPTPGLFNLDLINAFTSDTVVSENALTFDDLGIVPHKLKGYPIEFLLSYRKGGPQFGSTISERVDPEAFP